MSTRRYAVVEGRYADADPAVDVPDALGWAPATLPLDVHRHLVADGRIADPDRGSANEACGWVQDRAWWLSFALPDLEAGPVGDLTVVLDRLDTQATVWLDGVLLGTHANAFRPATFPLPSTLRGAVLTVRLDPPARDEDGTYSTVLQRLRKPAYGYGWDFAPLRPSLGIGSVTVVRRDRAAIGHVEVRTISVADPALLSVRVDADTADGVTVLDGTTAFELCDPGGAVVASAQAPAGVDVELAVEAPRLWWTHDRGEPALYTLTARLLVDGEVVDTDVRRVGIRTISLDRSADDAGGEHFRFVLNGVVVASFGANWAPSGMAPAAPDDTRAERLLTLARDAGMSMLRIWGGGYYETDAFYDTCDRLGMLVFHDFMFANRVYPVDPEYLAEIEAEATHQVRRLSGHPCLALWCGSNEIELVAEILQWPDPVPSPELFHELLPRIVAAHSDLGYIGSSPCAGNARNRGDRHNWQVWHGVDVDADDEARELIAWCYDRDRVARDDPMAQRFVAAAHPRRYRDDVTRFASEYGLGSYPAYSVLERWLDPQALAIDQPQLLARSRPGRLGPQNKVELFLAATVGVPTTLPEYVRATQLMQAEGIKVATEHYRRLWPTCAGELLWQLDDCWPAISWSLVDHDLQPKPAWYYARRFCVPVLVSVRPVDGGIEVWLTNNGAADIDELLDVRVNTFDGNAVWSAQVAASAQAGSSAAVARWSLGEVGAGPSTYLTVTGRTVANRHLFGDVVELQRSVPGIVVTEERDGDRLSVTVLADSFALMVTVSAGSAAFDDNCFDLHAGEARTVTAYGVPADTPVTVAAS